MTQVLDRRALNRATLARQHLLARADLGVVHAVEHLAGMQAQAPLAPYVGLWTRLAGFDPVALADATESGEVVRLHLMRNTVHLVSADDASGWRPVFDGVLARDFASRFARQLGDVDPEAVASYADELLASAPRSRAQITPLLVERWPDADPSALAYVASHLLRVCQLPPRGVWGHGGAPVFARLEDHLGRPSVAVPVDELVLRYLGAFGPATVADIQVWSGLTRLGEVVDRLPLLHLQGEDGAVLIDLPEAPRPDGDAPAPVRFLPAYDNLLLSYKDRRRVNPEGRRVPLPPGDGSGVGSVLVDGDWAGDWRVRDGRLEVRTFAVLHPRNHDDVVAEGSELCRFLGKPEAEVVVSAAG